MPVSAVQDAALLRDAPYSKKEARDANLLDREGRVPVERRLPPPAHSEGEDKTKEKGGEPRRPKFKKYVGISLGALLIAAAAVAGYLYWDDASHYESTDDAFIAARQYTVAPKVGGNIVAVPVTDNQHVNAGDVIARIDDRDYQASLAQANAQIAAAKAQIQTSDAQLVAQTAQIAQAKANVDQAQANLVFAKQQSDRYETLAKTGAGSIQNSQQYTSQLQQTQASLASAQAAEAAAEQQVGVIKAQRASAEASLAQAQAQREQAELNLSYTVVTATQPGKVAQLTGSVGQLAQAGTGIAILVPDEIWVAANFKETQLTNMKPGQPVDMEIDAYPNRALKGHVASVQPGSGTAFSLLPAENATGNYVKIVQRVPVKLILDNPPADLPLGPGMSVVPTVRTDPTPSLYEKLKARL